MRLWCNSISAIGSNPDIAKLRKLCHFMKCSYAGQNDHFKYCGVLWLCYLKICRIKSKMFFSQMLSDVITDVITWCYHRCYQMLSQIMNISTKGKTSRWSIYHVTQWKYSQYCKILRSPVLPNGFGGWFSLPRSKLYLYASFVYYFLQMTFRIPQQLNCFLLQL